MDVNKLIKIQYKRHKEIEKIFKCKGAKIRSLKDKIRIEGKDRLVQNRRNLCLSAGCIVTWGNYIGYFRYKEFYNKKSHKLIGRAYVISDENDKQIRIYDDKHGKLEYHDVEYDTDGKPQKRNTVSFNGSSKDIVDDCLRLLTDRESYSGGYLGADKLSIVSKDGDEDEKSKTNSELANSRKKYIATEPTESPEDKILKDCKKRIYILLEFYDRLYSLLGEIFNQRIRRWSPPSKDVGLIYLRMCRFIEIRLRILESDLGYLGKIGILPEEIDFQAVDDPDINIFYEMKEMKWFPFEHIINVNRDDWEKNGKKICGDFLGKITKLWLSFKKEPGEVYKISDSSQLELLKSVENVIKHYRKLDKGPVELIKKEAKKSKKGIDKRTRKEKLKKSIGRGRFPKYSEEEMRERAEKWWYLKSWCIKVVTEAKKIKEELGSNFVFTRSRVKEILRKIKTPDDFTPGWVYNNICGGGTEYVNTIKSIENKLDERVYKELGVIPPSTLRSEREDTKRKYHYIWEEVRSKYEDNFASRKNRK